MEKFNIYAGLGGSFGGAEYQGTLECNDRATAEHCAYELAVEEYQSYEGYHGIMSWYDVARENGIDWDEDENEDEIDQLYAEEMETWIEYYVIPFDEDDNEIDEIIEL